MQRAPEAQERGLSRNIFHHWIYEMEASEKTTSYVRKVLQVPWMRDTYEPDLEYPEDDEKDALGMMWINSYACAGAL